MTFQRNHQSLPPFVGPLSALVTPFRRGAVDWDAWQALLEDQTGAGLGGIVVGSSAGEVATMGAEERALMVRRAVAGARGLTPIIAATGTNDTRETIARSVDAARAGADALIVTVPYYNKPSQDGIVQHFNAVASATGLPILIHSQVNRGTVGLAPDTLRRLSELERVAGFVGEPAMLAALFGQANELARLAGDDEATLTSYFHGGHGGLSTLANLMPNTIVAFHHACHCGDFQRIKRLQATIQPLIALLSTEPEPVLLKVALSSVRRGFGEAVRLPLVPASDRSRAPLLALLPDLLAEERSLAALAVVRSAAS